MEKICDYCGKRFNGSWDSIRNTGTFCSDTCETLYIERKEYEEKLEYELKKQQEEEQFRKALHMQKQMQLQQKQEQIQQAEALDEEAKSYGFLNAENALHWMKQYNTDDPSVAKQKLEKDKERWAKEAEERKKELNYYYYSLGAAQEPWKQLNRDVNNNANDWWWVPYLTGIVLPIVLRIAFKSLFEFLGWNVIFAIIIFASFSFLINSIIIEYRKHKIIMRDGILLHDKWPQGKVVYLACFNLGWDQTIEDYISYTIFLFFLLRHYLSLCLGFVKGFLISFLITVAIVAITYFTKTFGIKTKILKMEKELIGETEYVGIPYEMYKDKKKKNSK